MSKTISSNRANVRRAAVLSNPRFRALAAWALVFVVLTTAPLAFRRRYPIGAFCTILVAIIITSSYLTVVTVGSAIFAAYCAVVYSRNRRLALLAAGKRDHGEAVGAGLELLVGLG